MCRPNASSRIAGASNVIVVGNALAFLAATSIEV
jgi:hypothetical protein